MPKWNGEIMQRGKRTRFGAPADRAIAIMGAPARGSVERDLLSGLSEDVYTISEDQKAESERTDKTAEQFFEAPAREVEQSDFMLDMLEGVQDAVTSEEFEVLQREVNSGTLKDEFALMSRIQTLQENRKTYSFEDWANDRKRMTEEEIFADEAESQGLVPLGEGIEGIGDDAFAGVFEDVFSIGLPE